MRVRIGVSAIECVPSDARGGATIAEQEATTEALKAKIVHQEKAIGLMRNLIISFCAFCQHKAG